MNRCCLFKASVHPMPLPRHLAVEILWHNCSDAIHRWCVGSSGDEDPATKSSLLAFMQPSDRPTLPLDQGIRSSGADDFILARLCLDSNWASDRPTVSSSDHPVLLRCCSSSATRPTHLEIGPSVHPMVPRILPSEPTRSTIAPTLAIWVSSVHPTVTFLFLSSSVLTFDLLILTCDILASLGPRSVYKDMLNNMVSPIDHVVMNHQNQTLPNGIWGHVRYNNTYS
jgi:hypothetical protein